MSDNKNGLLGYYFGDDEFPDLKFIAPTENDKLDFNKDSSEANILQAKIHAVR